MALAVYPLAPEFPFPAAADDCYKVYTGLQQLGIPASRMILLGHSAGANLALVTMMRARDRGEAQPAGTVALSAPTDLTCSEAEIQEHGSDCMLTPRMWPWVRQHYLNGSSPHHPDVSPALGDWRGLAPIQFHVSTSELLHDDNRRAVASAAQSGVDATLTTWPGMSHSFAFIDLLPEAARCRDQIARFAISMLSKSDERVGGSLAGSRGSIRP